MEARFLVMLVRLGVQHAVRLDEDDPLRGEALDPQYEIRVEAPRIEESDAFAPARTAQQIDLSVRPGLVLLGAAIRPQVLHQTAFSVIEARRLAPDPVVSLDQQRLVQMAVEVNSRQLLRVFPVDAVGFLDECPNRAD